MKTVSKLIITLLFLAGATAANAQFKAGLRFGGNLSNIITDEEDFKERINEKIGFHGGITAEYMFSPSIGIQTAILYSEKGSKLLFLDTETSIEDGRALYKVYLTPKLGYIEMPLHAVYKLPLGAASSLTFSAGPYIGYGVTEKIKMHYDLKFTGDITKESKKETRESLDEFTENMEKGLNENIVLFKEDGILTPFDFGAGLSVGYELLQRFEIKAGMDMGLKNILRENEDESIKNTNIYLSLGFKF